MDKENVLFTYNETLFSLRKEGMPGTCNNMYELWGHYTKSQTDKYCMILLIWGIKIDKFIEAERRMVVARG